MMNTQALGPRPPRQPGKKKTSGKNFELTGVRIRKIIATKNEAEKKKYPQVFYLDGEHAGQVKPPYWPLVIGVKDSGARWLPDCLIDQAVPLWREYMIPGALVPKGFEPCQKTWSRFRDIQRKKYRALRKPYPAPQSWDSLSVKFAPDTDDDDLGLPPPPDPAVIARDKMSGDIKDVLPLATKAFLGLSDMTDELEFAISQGKSMAGQGK